MVKARSLTALLAGCIVVSACQSEGETGPRIEDLPAELATLACADMPTCTGPLFLPVFLNGMACTDLYTSALAQGTLPVWQKSVERGSLVYHPNKAKACLDAIQAAGCGFWQDHVYVPECEAALQGTRGEGKECLADEECVGDLFCKVDVGCPGRCSARVAVAGACTDDGQCQSGLVCFKGACAAPLAEGASCSATQVDCKAPLLCHKTDGAQAGTCGPVRMTGNPGDACDVETWRLCAGDAVCALTGFDLTAKKAQLSCQAKVAATDVCRVSLPSQCPAGTACTGTKFDGLPLDFEGVCTALPGKNQPCATNTLYPPTCATGLFCVDKLCVEKANLDAACRYDDECHSGRCAGGKCVPKDPCTIGTPAPK